MDGMFQNADSFNQPLSAWNVSGVTDMTRMFHGADSFNQPLNSWDVSAVTDMTRMFSGAEAPPPSTATSPAGTYQASPT